MTYPSQSIKPDAVPYYGIVVVRHTTFIPDETTTSNSNEWVLDDVFV